MDEPIAGISAPLVKMAHLQRLMAFAVTIFMCTFIAWATMLSSLTIWAGLGRIFREIPTILFATVCHCLAAFARYLISDIASPVDSLPDIPAMMAIALAHAVLGVATGYCSWRILVARAAGTALEDSVAVDEGVLGGFMAVGAASGSWCILAMLSERRNHMTFGVPEGAAMRFLWEEMALQVRVGLKHGAAATLAYWILRWLAERMASTPAGPALAFVLGLPVGTAARRSLSMTGLLIVMGTMFLSAAANVFLHKFLTSIMHVIVTAPQDFFHLWNAMEGSASTKGRAGRRRPDSAAAMLLDVLRIGHESVMEATEKEVRRQTATTTDPLRRDEAGSSRVDQGSSAGRDSVGKWEDEIERQRLALELSVERCAAMGGGGLSGLVGGSDKEPVPIWAQVAKLQALQSLARKAPSSKDLRKSLYEAHVPQVLRTLCLELDCTSILLQTLAFKEDRAAAARVLDLEGRADVEWLVLRMGSPETFRDGGARWLKDLREGLTLPMHGVLDRVVLQPLSSTARRALGVSEQGRGGGGGAGVHAPGLSSIRARGATWAAQGLGALMVHAPGEARAWDLEPLLPVVLGSLSALLLAARPFATEGDGSGMAGEGADLQAVAAASEEALRSVALKYRSCLPSYRFPVAYATTINRLCS